MSQITSILGFASARSTMMGEARNSSRRCTIVTLLANFVRNVASSIAVSPPPTTTSSRSRKKKPSQVAQALTPRPRSFSSPGTFSHFALAPVATISVLARHSWSPAHTPNGRLERSTRVTCTGRISAPNRSGLLLHLLHQLGAEDAVDEAGIVLDVRREHQLSAGVQTLEHEGREVGAGGVQGGGVARRARSDHDHVAGIRHGASNPPIGGNTRLFPRPQLRGGGRGYSCAEEKERMLQSSVANTHTVTVSVG